MVVRLWGWQQAFCTRCTFQWSACAITAIGFQLTDLSVGTAVWTVVLGVLPMPALVDWVTQTWGYRESTTPLRAFTGVLLGCGFGMELTTLLRLDVTMIAIGVGVYMAYISIIVGLFSIKRIPGSYLKDLEDAFPARRQSKADDLQIGTVGIGGSGSAAGGSDRADDQVILE